MKKVNEILCARLQSSGWENIIGGNISAAVFILAYYKRLRKIDAFLSLSRVIGKVPFLFVCSVGDCTALLDYVGYGQLATSGGMNKAFQQQDDHTMDMASNWKSRSKRWLHQQAVFPYFFIKG